MTSKHQMTGMLGVYLAAAELTNRGLVASPRLVVLRAQTCWSRIKTANVLGPFR